MSRCRWDKQLGQAVLGNSTASGGDLRSSCSHHPPPLPLDLSSRLGREVGHTPALETLPVEA